jgi:hypothetical protein
MTTTLRRAIALLVALGVTFGIAALSRVSYTPEPTPDAMLRLSWRVPGEYIEECRTPSAEELARQPVHMRRELVCEGSLVPYRLRVQLDGHVVIDETVHASGARQDRPLYVLRELRLTPGSYHVDVNWSPALELPRTESDATPPPDAARTLTLAAELSLAEREIALITYDVDDRVLRARGAGLVRSENGVR